MNELGCKRKFKKKEQKIISDARLGVKKYKDMNKTIAKLQLEDIGNKNNANKNEIARLQLEAIKYKAKVDDDVHKAAEVMGIF